MRKFTLYLLLAGMIVMLAAIGACDNTKGDGGAAADISWAISGLARMTTGTSGNYKCALTGSQALIAEYEWTITGVGKITKNNGADVTVTASKSGVINLKLRVKDTAGNWSPWAEKTIRVSSPTFVVDLGTPAFGMSATGTPAKGTSAVWKLTGVGGAGVLDFRAETYSISFAGDLSGLPDNVQVKVTWVMQNATTFKWGSNTNNTDSETFSIPKAGGSIGNGGTVIATGWRPDTQWDNPPVTATGQTLGTVTFTAPGVRTLTLTIKNANVP